ncbi:MAG: ACP S-malonyltransferase [Mollicutes bacterium]|nr:ACP S-malonyltransferase [Mollicutes bacterium]
MKIAYLFPGQGSQFISMGKDLYESYEDVKRIYDEVEKITNINIKDISFKDNNLINETKYTQLAILTHSLSILEILKKNDIKPYMSAGLSLGEYTALINSGIIDFKEGIKLVQKRGEFMQEYLPKGGFKMIAVIGLKDTEVEKICEKIDNVYPANYNSYEQIVVSGLEKNIDIATIRFKEKGAKVLPLNTSGPFHTKFLINSSKHLKEELKKIKFNKGNNYVVRNIDGNIYKEKDDYVQILSDHIISPVKFTKVIEKMLEKGVNTFIEIGPGKILSNLVKKINKEHNKEVQILNIQDKESLINTLSILKGE